MPWWLSLIIALVTNLPKIISIVKDIIALIHNINPPAARAQAWADLANAVKSYQANGDTSGLKSLHDKLSTVGTPPDLAS
jgi:hypothetical protein